MDVVAAVQGGLINLQLVSYLQSNGIESIGLSGIDRGIFNANYLNEAMGFVGEPEQVGCNKWLDRMLDEGVIPVYSSICKDETGNLMNVNADLFANALAVSLNVDTVFFISDIEGVYINGVCQENLTQSEINQGILNNDITDGMIPKLLSCIHLLSHGIDKIWIGNEKEFVSHKDNFKANNIGGTWIGKSKKIAV
jgi:acetylglutamate kinase